MAEKIKVLQIITVSKWGGAQRVVFDLTTNFPKDKFLVEVATSPGGLLVKKLKEKGIMVYEIPSLQREISLTKDFKTFFALRKIIKKGKYDVVHCHSTKAGFLGRLAAKFSLVKKVYFTVHSWAFYNKGEYGRKTFLFKWLEKIGSLFSLKIICVSDKVMADGIKNKIAKPEKFLSIKNGTDFNLKEAKQSIREEFNISRDKIIVAMTSRLAHPKNPMMFLRAAGLVKNHLPEVKFILIGDGPQMQECRQFIQDNGLGETAALLGEKSPQDTRKLIKACDIFVLCSFFEGLPITIIEAMAAGLPVIASNVGGVRELVKNNETGFLLDTNDPGELADRIIYMIKKMVKTKQMGKNAQAVFKKDFTVDKMVSRYEKLYLNA